MCWTSITGLPLAACNANILPKNIPLSYNKYKLCEHFPGFLWLSPRCLYLCQSSFPVLQQWFRSWECLLSFPSSRSSDIEMHSTVSSFQQCKQEHRSEEKHWTESWQADVAKICQELKLLKGTPEFTLAFYLKCDNQSHVKWEMGWERGEKLRKKSTKNVQDSKRTIRSYIWLCIYLLQDNSSQMIAHLLAKQIN